MKRTLILFTVTIALIYFLCSCHKEKVPTLPVLSSTEISNITDSTAISGGVISDNGNADIIVRGVCWSLIENPTIADSKTSDGIGGGTYTSKLSKLSYATIYHVRAYATNSVGTAYGNDIVFSTNAILPTLTTDSISAITQISAHCGGKIILDGGTITARGVCWSTTSTPTITNNKTSDGSGSGNFSSVLSDLTNNTTYYVRAYATNDAGTGYGNIVSFIAGTVKDFDGNLYHTITIGTQVWLVENLKTTHFNDGTEISKVTDNTIWGTLVSPAYCTYKNTTNVDTINTFGILYNGYAVKTGKICPKGCHVPSDAEWTTLENYLITNGYNYDGSTTENKCAKSLASVTNWTVYSGTGTVGNSDYPNKRNATDFTAQPGGYRVIDGFHSIGLYSGWWTSTDYEYVSNALYDRYLSYNYANIYRASSTGETGLYIRCIKD